MKYDYGLVSATDEKIAARLINFEVLGDGQVRIVNKGPLGSSYQYQVTDNLGRVILQGKVDGQTMDIDLNGQATGHYTLTVKDQRKKPYSLSFIKFN